MARRACHSRVAAVMRWRPSTMTQRPSQTTPANMLLPMISMRPWSQAASSRLAAASTGIFRSSARASTDHWQSTNCSSDVSLSVMALVVLAGRLAGDGLVEPVAGGVDDQLAANEHVDVFLVAEHLDLAPAG